VAKWTGGQFLVASPYLTDGNFFRSVVYVVRHDAEGAFGLVVNRPSGQFLDEAFLPMLGRPPKRNDPIYLGGPVNGPLVAIHRVTGLGEPADSVTGDHENSSIWLTADEDHLRTLVDKTDVSARFVARYSGWGPSQLDDEIESGSWLVAACEPTDLFGDAESIWETIVKRLGHEILARAVAHSPFIDPLRN